MPNKPNVKPHVAPKPVKPVKPIVSPPVAPAPMTDLQAIQSIADATRSAAKMPSKYSDGDLPNWLAYLVAYKSGKNLPEPTPVAVPTDIQNYNGQLSALTMLLMAAGQVAGMPTVQGNSTAKNYTLKDLPAWITSLKL